MEVFRLLGLKSVFNLLRLIFRSAEIDFSFGAQILGAFLKVRDDGLVD
ncbi:hypothetical protein HMPREF9441_01567 [Paraprevotella clara YIT 11840]|uniref:Uncharacterized protein n=1 Tax=Paraprevotella clara YIT 11840 TaxID=762968 RepID=G5SQC9_9BACT|nr:hypothetical protein HMPREF9441_01567 [Paraprevotella clara YIT 11840]